MGNCVYRSDEISTAPDGRVYPIPSPIDLQASFNQLAKKMTLHRSQGRQIVVVQGLGFVGVAVAAAIAAARDAHGMPLHFVIGVDLPHPNTYWKVARVNEGLSPIVSPDAELTKLIYEGVAEVENLCATVSEQAYSIADVIVVDVPLNVRDRFAQAPKDVDVDIQG